MVVTKHSTLPTALSISASLSAADNTENTCTALQRILTVFQAHKLLEVTCQCQAEGQGGQMGWDGSQWVVTKPGFHFSLSTVREEGFSG